MLQSEEQSDSPALQKQLNSVRLLKTNGPGEEVTTLPIGSGFKPRPTGSLMTSV
jgi:hypothetical protein